MAGITQKILKLYFHCGPLKKPWWGIYYIDLARTYRATASRYYVAS